MRDDRNILQLLAANREARLGDDGRPRFELREDELERSTHTAMRLAQAAKSQIEIERTVVT
jgi:hypothetical protein